MEQLIELGKVWCQPPLPQCDQLHIILSNFTVKGQRLFFPSHGENVWFSSSPSSPSTLSSQCFLHRKDHKHTVAVEPNPATGSSGLMGKSAVRVEYCWDLTALWSVTVGHNLWKPWTRQLQQGWRWSQESKFYNRVKRGASSLAIGGGELHTRSLAILLAACKACQPIIYGPALPFHRNQACTSNDDNNNLIVSVVRKISNINAEME